MTHRRRTGSWPPGIDAAGAVLPVGVVARRARGNLVPWGELVMCRGTRSVCFGSWGVAAGGAGPAIGPSSQEAKSGSIGVVALAAARRRAPLLLTNIGIERF